MMNSTPVDMEQGLEWRNLFPVPEKRSEVARLYSGNILGVTFRFFLRFVQLYFLLKHHKTIKVSIMSLFFLFLF